MNSISEISTTFGSRGLKSCQATSESDLMEKGALQGLWFAETLHMPWRIIAFSLRH
jgi:hypothetical protein